MKACKSAEELMKFASDAGIALSDELLEAVAGGIYQDYIVIRNSHPDNQ